MEVRIGVFICDCGGSMRNINFPAIEEKLIKFSDVAHVGLSSNLCLEEGQEEILSSIKNKDINRVVVAACSPELKEHVFHQALENVGLNPYLLSMANIREQCSWAHEGDVTEEALTQIAMAVNKARLLEPVQREEIPVNRDVLVVGGGLVGMRAAHELSRLGMKATLVEREPRLGGRMKQLAGFYEVELTPDQILERLEKDIKESSNIEVLTAASVANIEGELGNFVVKVGKDGKESSQNFGAIIIATGYNSRSYKAEVAANVIAQSQLAELLRFSEKVEKTPQNVGFFLDVSDEHSRASTLQALNNALMLKEKFGSEVYIFCQNLKVDSDGMEKLYREARNHGVLFFKFGQSPPEVSEEAGRIKVQTEDLLLGEDVVALCDLLVLDEKPLPYQDFQTLNSVLRVGLDSRGFYQEENVHLYPVSSNRKGIFFAGNCHADLDITRALADAANAALSAYQLLFPGKIMVEVEKVKVDPDKCRLCLTCVRICPHNAIRVARVTPEKQAAKIFDPACDACGICAAICPAKAIRFEGYSDEQILSEIEAIRSAYE